MNKKTDSLLFKFAVIFLIFTIVTLAISSINTYLNQTNSYKEQAEENIKNIAKCLRDMIEADGENFLQYQNYLLKNQDKIFIRNDFSSYQADKKDFEQLFAKQYPDKTFGVDVKFDDMPDNIKIAFTKYYQEYWLSTFEKFRNSFGIMYAYYVVPGQEQLHMVYVVDGLRETKMINDIEYLRLAIDVLEPVEEHEKMWEAFETGKSPNGYDVYDNEFGKTYAYYTPLNIGGQTVGVIGTEIEIETVNKEILRLTLDQMAGMGTIILICVLALLGYIHQNYILKLEHLQSNVREYSQKKDPEIVNSIEKEANGKDEIASLSMQIAAMILELENYMRSLIKVAKELSSAREQADLMHELAHKDSLTGVNNKNAYDSVIHQLDWKIDDGTAEFAIVMIDLNFLKRINDTYGHESGNTAIQNLCEMVKDFFPNSPIFRIGGDEFVVVAEGEDYAAVTDIVKKFNSKLDKIAANKKLEPWEKTSAALGLAIYDKSIDSSAANVFKRADKAMYARKKEMKAVRI